jgi:iduronate 2-sulfatase
MMRHLLLAALCLSPAPAVAADRPNVLFIFIDDLRTECGCYGVAGIKTPNIDRLAAAGVRFDKAYCQFPLCNPSRTSLLTGRYPVHTGVLDNTTWFGAAHPDWVTLPKYFKQHGYPTLRTGKVFHGGIDDTDAWTEGGEKRNFEGAKATPMPPANRQQQSDRWIVLEGDGESHGDFKNTNKAIDYLRKHKDGPFFLAFGLSKPHSPPTAPKKFFDLYDPKDVPLPPDFAATPAAPPGFPKQSITPNGDLFIRRAASPEAAREMKRAYWASTSWVDWNVGRVLAELDALGLRDKTVIVLWGDHGYHLGEKGKWAKHGSLYEVGARVPMVFAAPGAKGNGKVCPRVVQALDFYPTLCDLCGLPPPPGVEGLSLRPLLDDPAAAWDHPAYTVFGNGAKLIGVAVRTEKYRFAEYDGGNGGAMLFDEQADPHELTNRVDDPTLAKVKEQLAALAKKHAAERK